jgi:hypothetical protein
VAGFIVEGGVAVSNGSIDIEQGRIGQYGLIHRADKGSSHGRLAAQYID